MEKYIKCTWMRGGTSKGACFLESELSTDISTQNSLLSKIYGSNDPSGRQIDGMGGGTSTTSKAVIVSKRAGERNGVNYTFAQVDVASDLVDRKGNCGNMSSTVGPFAIDNGLVEDITEPTTQVQIFNTNTQKTIVAHVPVKNGKVVYSGDYAISGVPGTAARIQLDFLSPGGAVTKKLLPTGRVVDTIELADGQKIDISIVDAANPLVFVRAQDLGLTGSEMPKDIDSKPELLEKMLAIREAASVMAQIATNLQEAKTIQQKRSLPYLNSALLLHQPVILLWRAKRLKLPKLIFRHECCQWVNCIRHWLLPAGYVLVLQLKFRVRWSIRSLLRLLTGMSYGSGIAVGFYL